MLIQAPRDYQENSKAEVISAGEPQLLYCCRAPMRPNGGRSTVLQGIHVNAPALTTVGTGVFVRVKPDLAAALEDLPVAMLDLISGSHDKSRTIGEAVERIDAETRVGTLKLGGRGDRDGSGEKGGERDETHGSGFFEGWVFCS
ncbi:hypothetical protein BGZ83_006736 [Gryganskiella cystojenkinii]|nr:hypothetical protein BGZ83_006736 [Gryganskiella cystojenkinii]